MLIGASAIAQSEKFNRIEVGYANSRIATVFGSGVPMHGAGIGFYTVVQSDNRLFIECGLTAAFAACDRSGTQSIDEQETMQHYAMKHLWASIPVNVGYDFQLTDDYAIRPYVGLACNAGIYGHSYNKTMAAMTIMGNDVQMGNKIDSKWYGSDDDTLRRFRLSGQIGLQLRLKDYSIGYQYQGDFTRMDDESKTRIRTSFVSIGRYF